MRVRQHANGDFWLAKRDENLEAELDALYVRVRPGELRWKNSGKTLPEKLVSFVSAITSPEVEASRYKERLAICESCPFINSNARGKFCMACGCGERNSAELHNKLKMSRATCPHKKWS